MTTRLLTLREVTRMTALSRSAVYALMGESRFPKLEMASRKGTPTAT
jgi:predicted DNA-binding transcriptional regulator AlpA